MIPQPGTSGDWTVYMTGDETPRIDEVNSVLICVTRCTNQGFYDRTIVIVFLSFYLYKYQQKIFPIESLADLVTLYIQRKKGFTEVLFFFFRAKDNLIKKRNLSGQI